jgi:ABC-2 type transport system ATP-binding protein
MIEIRQLQKIINYRTVLDIDDLTIPDGETAGIVGPADSGKEVLFDLLIGRMEPSLGSVRLAGAEPHDKARFSQQVGVLFEEDGLYARLNPFSNLMLNCRLYGLPKVRAQETLARIGLADQGTVKIDKLSSGLQRRLAFGRCLLHHPTVLVLYEPFTRCDEATIQIICSLIKECNHEGCSVLILADDTAYLEETCDTIYLLNLGRIKEATITGEGKSGHTPFLIPVQLQDKVRLVNPKDILYAEAEGNYACLQTEDERLPTRFSLTDLETRLALSGFFRAHRSFLVNLQHVKEVIPYTRNSYSLRLSDPSQTEIPLSRSAAGQLRDLLGY